MISAWKMPPARLDRIIEPHTVRASTLAPALASATKAARQDAAVRAQARAALTRLEHREQFSTSHFGRGGTTLLTGQGFLPGHPVRLSIYGREIVTLHADGHGSVSYQINPSALGLPRPAHGRPVRRRSQSGWFGAPLKATVPVINRAS